MEYVAYLNGKSKEATSRSEMEQIGVHKMHGQVDPN